MDKVKEPSNPEDLETNANKIVKTANVKQMEGKE
jgi:hypothetical protein